jgi:hypothetical protein
MSNTGGMETTPIDWLPWFDTIAREHPRRNEYVGLMLADVATQIGNSHPLRVIDTNVAEAAAGSGQYPRLLMDQSLNRVNLLARDGVVIAAAMFERGSDKQTQTLPPYAGWVTPASGHRPARSGHSLGLARRGAPPRDIRSLRDKNVIDSGTSRNQICRCG